MRVDSPQFAPLKTTWLPLFWFRNSLYEKDNKGKKGSVTRMRKTN